MTAVTISGTFSKDERTNNGLEAIAEDLLEDQLGRHYVIGLVQFAGGSIPGPGEPTVPRVKFVAIEPLTGGDADHAKDLLDKARKARNLGQVEETLFDGHEDDPDGDDGE